jgi:ADP-heptose:LPS heptosyltransferase
MFFAPSRKLAARRLERGGPRIYDPRERALLAAFDLALRAGSLVAGLRPAPGARDPARAERILALRLDRLGDLVTTLPALQALREAAPEARIELAVGSWNEPIARSLPFVDAVRIVDAPWAAWGKKASFREARRAVASGGPFDLALEFQGDVRALLLAALSGAPLRAGYGETGGGYLLTHPASWDESRSWYWQNMELVRTLFPGAGGSVQAPTVPYNFLDESDRQEARDLLASSGLAGVPRPLIGIQPSAGRSLKEWEPAKFSSLVDALAGRATVVLTGASADASLVEQIASRARARPGVVLGAPLRAFAALIERLDVFVTGDTGPMHLCHAVGTPNVAIFGPSDPRRYGPDDALGLRRVVRHELFCSPCNMIRRPPSECLRPPAPECLAAISVERVLAAVLEALA